MTWSSIIFITTNFMTIITNAILIVVIVIFIGADRWCSVQVWWSKRNQIPGRHVLLLEEASIFVLSSPLFFSFLPSSLLLFSPLLFSSRLVSPLLLYGHNFSFIFSVYWSVLSAVKQSDRTVLRGCYYSAIYWRIKFARAFNKAKTNIWS